MSLFTTLSDREIELAAELNEVHKDLRTCLQLADARIHELKAERDLAMARAVAAEAASSNLAAAERDAANDMVHPRRAGAEARNAVRVADAKRAWLSAVDAWERAIDRRSMPDGAEEVTPAADGASKETA